MVHKLAVGLIDLTAFGLFDSEGLNGRDDDDRAAIIIGPLRIERFGHSHDANILAEPVGESAPIGMCAILQSR
jgi:hypothetical protein